MPYSKLAVCLLVGSVAWAGTARALDLVLDEAVVNTTQATVDNTAAIEKSAGAIADSTAKTLQTLTTPPSDVANMFSDQDGSTEQDVMPSDVISDVKYVTPSQTTTGKTIADNNNYNDQVMTATDPESVALKSAILTAANIQGMAVDNLSALHARLGQLSEMGTQLASAKSITEVTAITGRIAVEQLAVQAEQAQAANLGALAVAQTELDLTNREQAIRAEHIAAGLLFSTSAP